MSFLWWPLLVPLASLWTHLTFLNMWIRTKSLTFIEESNSPPPSPKKRLGKKLVWHQWPSLSVCYNLYVVLLTRYSAFQPCFSNHLTSIQDLSRLVQATQNDMPKEAEEKNDDTIENKFSTYKYYNTYYYSTATQ